MTHSPVIVFVHTSLRRNVANAGGICVMEHDTTMRIVNICPFLVGTE